MKKLDIGKKAIKAIGKRATKIGKRLPTIPKGYPVGQPVDLDPADGLEVCAEKEVSALLASLRASRNELMERFKLEDETDYWLCLCFQSNAQKEEFVKRVGWLDCDDYHRYFNGLDVARQLGIEIEPIELVASRIGKPRKLTRKEVI